MALVFRWYLGMSSRWAIDGDADAADRLPDLVRPGDGRLQRAGSRARSSPSPANRTVVQIARNLLEGAAVVTRAQQLRTYGVAGARRGVPVPARAGSA